MYCFIKGLDWNSLLHNEDLTVAVDDFYSIISPSFDKIFPSRRVKVSSNDPVFVSPLVKLLLKKRRKFIRMGMFAEADSLQPRIDKLIHENQVSAVKTRNNKHEKTSSQWWQTVNTMTGRAPKEIALSLLFSVEDTNKYFKELTRMLIMLPLHLLLYQKALEFQQLMSSLSFYLV